MRKLDIRVNSEQLKEKLGLKDIDLKPIIDGISCVEKAIKDNKFDKINTDNIEKLLQVISDKKQDNTDIISAIKELVAILTIEKIDRDYSDKFDELITATSKIQLFRPAYNSYDPKVRNTDDEYINPATEETLQASSSAWISSNIDMADATYYYFLSFISNTTKWRINRLNKTSYVSDYATGDSAIATAWTNRATQTYATIY